MLGAERGIVLSKPRGRSRVELAAARAQQRCVGAFLDEGMGEEESIAFRQDQGIRQERVAGIVGNAHQMSQQRQLETLADHRGGLKGLAVERRQAIHARQHQALQRGGKYRLAAFLGVAQQLLKK
jgi:hypothetical protein